MNQSVGEEQLLYPRPTPRLPGREIRPHSLRRDWACPATRLDWNGRQRAESGSDDEDPEESSQFIR